MGAEEKVKGQQALQAVSARYREVMRTLRRSRQRRLHERCDTMMRTDYRDCLQSGGGVSHLVVDSNAQVCTAMPEVASDGSAAIVETQFPGFPGHVQMCLVRVHMQPTCLHVSLLLK